MGREEFLNIEYPIKEFRMLKFNYFVIHDFSIKIRNLEFIKPESLN